MAIFRYSYSVFCCAATSALPIRVALLFASPFFGSVIGMCAVVRATAQGKLISINIYSVTRMRYGNGISETDNFDTR